MMASSVMEMIVSSELSMIAFMRWAISKARLCSVTSRWIADVPMIAPCSSRIGERVIETGNTVPSFGARTVSTRSTCSPALIFATQAAISAT